MRGGAGAHDAAYLEVSFQGSEALAFQPLSQPRRERHIIRPEIQYGIGMGKLVYDVVRRLSQIIEILLGQDICLKTFNDAPHDNAAHLLAARV